MIEQTKLSINQTLLDIFGYHSFRDVQENIIKSILNKQNTFVIMPTGSGKSLCYQLPAIALDEMAIVVSPLLSIMKDQINQLQTLGIYADTLNSTLLKKELIKVKKDILNGSIKLLYISPESLIKEEYTELLKKKTISFAAIDEAHCVSTWGHDFRPEYSRLKDILRAIGDFPIMALTATATVKVQRDIQENLGMTDANVFKLSFNRKNLYYEIRSKKNSKKQIIRFIKNNPNKPGIIYCQSRKRVEDIAQFLKINGIKAAAYHAGLDIYSRAKNQDAFLYDEVDIIVATIAFGMGVHKSNIRFIIHYDIPKSLENYYQETGRAGRDGLHSICILFYSKKDVLRMEKLNKSRLNLEYESYKQHLEEVSWYAETSVCRRYQLLHYFGEILTEECNNCDNCLNPQEKFGGMNILKNLLLVVQQIHIPIKIVDMIDILKGSNTRLIDKHYFSKLGSFGACSDEQEEFIKTTIKHSLLLDFLEKDSKDGGNFLFTITKKGEDFLKHPNHIDFSKDHNLYFDAEEEKEEYEESGEKRNHNHYYTPIQINDLKTIKNDDLFSILKNIRKNLAKEKNLAAYIIFEDISLEEMATTYPTMVSEMSLITGVGKAKAEKYGSLFIDVIKEYITQNNIIVEPDIVVKTAGGKSTNKIQIIHQIDRHFMLDDIAHTLQISFENLIEEMEHISHSGTKLNIKYYLDATIDDDKVDEIYNYFLTNHSAHIDTALNDLSEDITENEIRLVRIHFLSECGK